MKQKKIRQKDIKKGSTYAKRKAAEVLAYFIVAQTYFVPQPDMASVLVNGYGGFIAKEPQWIADRLELIRQQIAFFIDKKQEEIDTNTKAHRHGYNGYLENQKTQAKRELIKVEEALKLLAEDELLKET